MYKDEKIHAKVVAGEVFGVKGPVTARTPAYFIDFTINKGVKYNHIIPKGWNSMLICHRGSFSVHTHLEDKKIKMGDACVFRENNDEDE